MNSTLTDTTASTDKGWIGHSPFSSIAGRHTGKMPVPLQTTH
ncbi:MAG: hypothetical protein SFY80_15475 [Verrucomicrobiota bacterium]|nr:hypothetical protein [Verrucomicrobiota bacterium]